MKRLLSILLALCLLVGAMSLAYAEELSVDTEETVEIDGVESSDLNESYAREPNETLLENQELPDTQEATPVKVSSYEELEVAVANAKDGAIIEISKQIIISGDAVIETDKHITLKRSDNFISDAYYCNAMFDIWADGTLKGFEIVDTAEYRQTIDLSGTSKVIDCHFDGENIHHEAFIKIKSQKDTGDKATISNCTFTNNESYPVSLNYNSVAICESCTFVRNNAAGIYNCGDLELIDCTITENWSGGIIAYANSTIMTNCKVYGNILADPEHGIGTDIYINGTLIITDDMEEEAGYYDEFTGEKVQLPYDNYDTIRFMYLTTEEATKYFVAKFAPEETEPVSVDPPSELEPQPPTNEDNSSQEPPKEQEGGDTNIDTELPQKPSANPPEDNDNSGSDYTPSIHWWPSVSSSPISSTPKDENDDDDIPLEDTPMLICGSAVIDTSRFVVLAGYGDGLLHEEDPLTRAQAAQIIYRLLTEESIEQFYTLENPFIDCPVSAWYNEAVSTIANAGIVAGCGNDQYCPNNLLTWAQALTILTRFTKIQEYDLQYITYNGWALQAVETAAVLGWIEDSVSLDINSIITRGDFVDLLNGVFAMY